jgi:hypothetical protein
LIITITRKHPSLWAIDQFFKKPSSRTTNQKKCPSTKTSNQKKEMTFNRANTSKEGNDHHYGKHIKRRQPSPRQAHEKKGNNHH